MKIKNAFSLLLLFSLLVGAMGVVPAGAHIAVSPMLEKGPQAILANVTTSTNPSYSLFTCQTGTNSYGDICYDPYQIRHAYGIDKLISAGFTGKGKTIVIVDAFQDANLVDDLNYFITFYGLPGLNGLGGKRDPKLATFTQIAPDGLGPVDDNWAGEITLDVEWSHAIAPGANITLVLAKSSDDADILSATKYAVDHKLGDVISQSFGEDESCVDPKILAQEHKVFADATNKNITLFASSGDEGAAQYTCDGSSYSKAVSSPASDPLVTGVGGTELHAADYCLTSLGCNPKKNPAPGTYQGEIAWNEPAIEAATGGGFSKLYDQPSYQKGTIPGKQRGVPDVSYSAAVYHGVLTYFYGDWYLFGGTSAGSPQWAAILSIADQKAGHDLGFINAALYQIGKDKKQYAANFFDITSGNNSVVEDLYDADGNVIGSVAVNGFEAGKGWDATTGLGSPSTNSLVNTLIKLVKPGDGKGGDLPPHSNGNPSAHGHVHEH